MIRSSFFKYLLLLVLVFFPFCDEDSESPDTSGAWLIPQDQVQDGGPGKDGIVALENPSFIPVSQDTYLRDFDLVLGIQIGDFIRAVPHIILDHHEIANHTIDGTSFTLTYCPLTGSGIAWDTSDFTVDSTFGVSGLLYNSNLIPYDRQTDSNWSQMLMLCVNGELIGQEPQQIHLVETTWETWKRLYPESMLMSNETGFNRNYKSFPYGSYKTDDRLIFPVSNEDDRLHKKERVHGVIVDETTKVYPLFSFGNSVSVVNDVVNGKSLIVAGSTDLNFAVSFERDFDGTTLKFIPVQDELPVIMMDTDGTRWDIFGNAVSGPGKGMKLTPTKSFIAYWFAWAAFYPGADIHGQSASNRAAASFERISNDVSGSLQARTFTRSRIGLKILREWPLIASRTQLILHAEGGISAGLLLYDFPGNTVLTELGFRRFDIIKAVDKTPVQNLAGLLEQLSALANANRIEVSVERQGQPLTLIYILN
jgi:hypothetical protein